MERINNNEAQYFEELFKRGKKSRITTKHQLIGLQISEILSDPDHKSLYMKMAMHLNTTIIMSLAKSIGESKKPGNKGAIFMHVLKSDLGNFAFLRKNPPPKI